MISPRAASSTPRTSASYSRAISISDARLTIRSTRGRLMRGVNPYRARIRTLLGSDIGHFDVVNMNEVLKEAYELVDDGLITEMDFREFVFTNPVRFWAEGNPDFFQGTALENEAAQELRDLSSSSG